MTKTTTATTATTTMTTTAMTKTTTTITSDTTRFVFGVVCCWAIKTCDLLCMFSMFSVFEQSYGSKMREISSCGWSGLGWPVVLFIFMWMVAPFVCFDLICFVWIVCACCFREYGESVFLLLSLSFVSVGFLLVELREKANSCASVSRCPGKEGKDHSSYRTDELRSVWPERTAHFKYVNRWRTAKPIHRADESHAKNNYLRVFILFRIHITRE